MPLNLNVGPYYDDYNEKKNYLRILFRPGIAVQSRELTQLQTALQKQIDRFGKHVFKDGSIVLNGNTNTSDVKWIDIEASNPSLSAGTYISSENFVSTYGSGVGQAKIFKIETISDIITRVYFNYVSGVSFVQGETIVGLGGVTYDIVDDIDFYGSAKVYSIVDSVFFVNGHFVFCEQQSIILYDNEEVVNLKVGLDINEEIVTAEDDESLLDPAAGSYNYAAPGADRYRIWLELNKHEFDPQTEADAEIGNFIELSRFVANELVHNVTSASYSDLETTLARRTYDQSGDYTVKSFGLKVKSHIFEDDDLLSLAIEPGKAYVKGYEYETIATTHVNLEKARDYVAKSGRQVQVDHGEYLIINTPGNSGTTLLNYTANPLIELRDEFDVVIGSARVRAIRALTAGTMRLYVYNVQLTDNNVISAINKVTYGDWYATISSTSYPNEEVTLIRSARKPFITKLPDTNIRSLLDDGVSDTIYSAHRMFQVTFASTSVNISTGSSDEVFLSNEPEDYLVVDDTTGVPVPVTEVTGSGTSRTITINASGFNAKIYTFVGVSNALQKNKTLVEVDLNGVAITLDKISLEKSDGYRLISVTARDSGEVEEDLDVTEFFSFNTGQTDEMYDHCWIKAKNGVTLGANGSIPAEYDLLDIKFEHFTQSSTNGFFSVDSYAGAIDYTDIPVYVSSSGDAYNLRDCLDFRPRRVDNSSDVQGGYAVLSNSIAIADYTYYLGRIDKLVLTKDRKFSVVKGVPSESPTIPTDMYDAMTLYILHVPAYTHRPEDVRTTFVENRRYTMRDIGKIEKRVERIEYYTALSLLEKQARDESIASDIPGVDRFKNGILVDSFSGHSVGDVNNPFYSCSIDPENHILRPRFAPYSFEYNATTITNAFKRGDLITLPYESDVLVEQPFATNWVNVNPYMVFNWNGMINIDPGTDTWIDIHTRPDVVINMNGENDVYTSIVDNIDNPASIGVRWNDWQTVNRGVEVTDNFSTNSTVATRNVGGSVLQTTTATTTNQQTTTVNETLLRTGLEIASSATTTVLRDLGNRIVDSSIVPFIRARMVRFSAKNLKPNTNLLAMFDGVDVTDFCSPADEILVSGVNEDATKIRSGVNKEAEIVMVKPDRVFVVLDADKEQFEVNDVIDYQIGGSWIAGGTISTINSYEGLRTNAKGDIAGSFYIPNNDTIRFRTGERVFRLADSLVAGATTAAETKYVAQGMSQSVERTIVATRIATVSINPVQETDAKTTSSTRNIVTNVQVSTVDITPPPPPPPPPVLINCGTPVSGNSSKPKHTFTLNIGTGIGPVNINYTAWSNPDRFTVIWDGKEYTSGFRGSSAFNTRLNAAGFPNVVGAGTGTLTFQKTKAQPATATIIVDAPLSGTAWTFTPTCPPNVAPITYNLSLIGPSTSTVNAIRRMDSWTGAWWDVPDIAGNTVLLTIRLNNGTSPANFGRVTLTTNRPGFTLSQNQVIIRNGTSATVAMRLNRVTAGLSTLDFQSLATFNGIVSASVLEVDANNNPIGGGQSATAAHNWSVVVNRPAPARDPIAQTFFIDGRSFPNGVYVNGIDLFFRNKSNTAPVMVQLRPVVNGYPSSSVVMPFGTASLDADQVNTSSDGSVSTHFRLDNIVHLAPGEYSFVVLSDSDEYEIFTSILGNFLLNNPAQRVTTQPTLGSMFKSQNASTWTPVQEEDVKFILHKCVFDTEEATIDFNTEIDPSHGDVPYDVFYTMGETVKFGATDIKYYYKTNADSSWNQYQLGSNIMLPGQRLLDSSNPNSLQFRVVMSSLDSNVTPIIDNNRLTSTLVKNIINDDATDETEAIGGNALARYITRKVKLNPGFEAKDLQVTFLANRPGASDIKVYYKVSTPANEIFENNDYIEMNLAQSGSYSETGYAEYKYTTEWGTALESGELFDTFAIKIVMLSPDTSKVPVIRDLRVIALDD